MGVLLEIHNGCSHYCWLSFSSTGLFVVKHKTLLTAPFLMASISWGSRICMTIIWCKVNYSISASSNEFNSLEQDIILYLATALKQESTLGQSDTFTTCSLSTENYGNGFSYPGV